MVTGLKRGHKNLPQARKQHRFFYSPILPIKLVFYSCFRWVYPRSCCKGEKTPAINHTGYIIYKCEEYIKYDVYGARLKVYHQVGREGEGVWEEDSQEIFSIIQYTDFTQCQRFLTSHHLVLFLVTDAVITMVKLPSDSHLISSRDKFDEMRQSL